MRLYRLPRLAVLIQTPYCPLSGNVSNTDFEARPRAWVERPFYAGTRSPQGMSRRADVQIRTCTYVCQKPLSKPACHLPSLPVHATRHRTYMYLTNQQL